MSAVNPVEAIKYGFELMAYLAAILIASVVIAAVGAGIFGAGTGMMTDSFVTGGILALIGGLVLILGYLVGIAGQLGIVYKVIADGVQQGVSEAR